MEWSCTRGFLHPRRSTFLFISKRRTMDVGGVDSEIDPRGERSLTRGATAHIRTAPDPTDYGPRESSGAFFLDSNRSTAIPHSDTHDIMVTKSA